MSRPARVVGGEVTARSSRQPSAVLLAGADVDRVDDVARVVMTREMAVLRRWGATLSDRPPRWSAPARAAMRLVIAATDAHGRDRHALLVEAAQIVVALREPRAHRPRFQRAEWLLEVAIGKLGNCAGCLAAGASTADKRLLARVRRVVNAADPIGLLRAGDRRDSYHPAIDEIAECLPEPECGTLGPTRYVVHRAFRRWFDLDAGPQRQYSTFARALHALRRQHLARTVKEA